MSVTHGQLVGTITNYDPATDTCSIELTGDGAFDAWIDGCKLAAAINRALAVSGAFATIDAPDVNRLCDLTVVAIREPGFLFPATTAGEQITQAGQEILFTDAGGHVPLTTIVYPVAFSTAPSVAVGGASGIRWFADSITPMGFNVYLTGATYAPNTPYTLVWSATGQA